MLPQDERSQTCLTCFIKISFEVDRLLVLWWSWKSLVWCRNRLLVSLVKYQVKYPELLSDSLWTCLSLFCMSLFYAHRAWHGSHFKDTENERKCRQTLRRKPLHNLWLFSVLWCTSRGQRSTFNMHSYSILKESYKHRHVKWATQTLKSLPIIIKHRSLMETMRDQSLEKVRRNTLSNESQESAKKNFKENQRVFRFHFRAHSKNIETAIQTTVVPTQSKDLLCVCMSNVYTLYVIVWLSMWWFLCRKNSFKKTFLKKLLSEKTLTSNFIRVILSWMSCRVAWVASVRT